MERNKNTRNYYGRNFAIFREKSLVLDHEICSKVYTNVYNGLTITNYLVPLIDIDIDPSLRVINEYNKTYDDCIIEDDNNIFQFNLR